MYREKMPSDPKSFVIIRSKWNYGEKDETAFLDHKGRMDCLGFFLRASGFKDEDLVGRYEPIDIAMKVEWFSALIEWCGKTVQKSAICIEIMQENDKADVPMWHREARLTELFRSIGVSLSFA